MGAVIAATTPLRALGFVAAATTATALGVALLRLLRTPNAPRPTHAAAAAAAVPVTLVPDGTTPDEARVLTDLGLIAATVHVQIQPDGSVTVTGIPDTVPPDLGHAIAEIALEAATRQLERTLRIRRTPNRDDRRVLTKVARDAIRAEAARRAGTTAA